MGVDYRPAVQEVGNALYERTDFGKPMIGVKSALENWLKTH